ncbi:MAG TPA: aminotransferase class III-fold pyridoxal phosphate-dependent enzyme [Roseiflexaceae bacterium]|nr:aminotransferase class III-fold pyridoxal phosphate-dependent enzyme [Roseiflexaceae bacterium]
MFVARSVAAPLSAQEATALAAGLYGLRAAASPLPGEYDANFHLLAGDGAGYILKVMHPDAGPAMVELQVALLDHLAAADPSLLLPRVCPTPGGERVATWRPAGGPPRLVWLLTHVPGRVLAEARPHTPELLESLGAYLGRLDAALAGFAHPAASRALKWDLARAGWIAEHLHAIGDTGRRALVERALRRFEEIAPRLPALRRSVIHNDANDYNVLVSGPHEWPQRAVSVIDFGDALLTATVCEVAIAAAYALLGKPDPLAAAAHVVAGYHRAYPLEEAEIAALFPLICARLAVSVTNAALRAREAPDDPYVTVSEAPAWEALARLDAIHPRLAHYTLRAACALPPVPHGERVAAWLRANAGSFAPVLDVDLRTAQVAPLDLSVGSTLLGADPRNLEREPLEAAIFGHIRAAGAAIGAGGYGEARAIYTAPAFGAGGHPTDERRTVHLGLDLWLQPGAPVYAPLAGTVRLLASNPARLDYGHLVVLEHQIATAGTQRTEGKETARGHSSDRAASAPSPSESSEPAVAEQLTFYTLYGHLDGWALEHLALGQPVVPGQRIGSVGPPALNGDWPPHLHVQIILDLLDLEQDYPGVARASQRDVWLALSPDPNLILSIPPARLPAPHPSAEETLAARRSRIGRSLSLSYRRPLKVVRGWMQYLYDDTGRAFLDVYNNVPHVGHSHPRVVKAVQDQIALLNTNTRYLHDAIVRYAGRLTALMPEPLRVCFFVNSASEANELALRLARAATGHKDMIVLDAAYHGHTTGLIDISPYKFNGPGGAGAPEWVHVAPIPDDYRGPYKRHDPQAGPKYAHHVADLVDKIMSIKGGLAGYIAESLPSVGGQIVPPPGYLAEVYAAVRAAGGVCIADEVQVGFGRLGSHFWGFAMQEVVPDIVVLGKPIGNGFPLGAVVTTPAIAAAFDNGMEFFSTFGGNPVACAAGLAVLDVVQDEGLQERARRVGGRLLAGLRELAARHPLVGDARGAGLFLGLELVRDRQTLEPADAEASYVVNRLRERCILAGTDGPYHNVIKIRPPLPFGEEDADFLLQALDETLAEDFVRRP